MLHVAHCVLRVAPRMLHGAAPSISPRPTGIASLTFFGTSLNIRQLTPSSAVSSMSIPAIRQTVEANETRCRVVKSTYTVEPYRVRHVPCPTVQYGTTCEPVADRFGRADG